MNHEIKNDESKNYFRLLAGEIDGAHSLLDVAEKWNIPMDALAGLAAEFERCGLIKLKQSAPRGKARR